MDKAHEKALEACRAFNRWLDAEGVFPDPEYDDFIRAMWALAESVDFEDSEVTEEQR